ncbi:MAG: hypothetical protein BM564_09710 [Bacteroidetes bacterium MedPE-SWsnd-G2]|nr:MAG: hypothetical protein BM564_09710 [Bacteroidetes bacterium MedPE-SWsnd-G2]
MKTTEVKAEVVEVKEKTIYEKLGGANGVSVLVDDIVAEHLKNEHIKHYFEPLKKDEAYFNQFKNHVKAFLAAGTGGSEQYSGRDMASAHQGLNLSADDFMHAIDDILIVLDRHNVDRASKNELLATLYSMKDAVMNQ